MKSHPRHHQPIGLSVHLFLLCLLLAHDVLTARADSRVNTVLPYISGTRITPGSTVNGGVRYSRVIRLKSSGTNNGVLLATFECWPSNFPFFKSTDDGMTWVQISEPTLSSQSQWLMRVEPDVFELPVAVGNLPAGTIMLAGNSATNGVNSHRMEAWFSTDVGVSWQYRGVADS